MDKVQLKLSIKKFEKLNLIINDNEYIVFFRYIKIKNSDEFKIIIQIYLVNNGRQPNFTIFIKFPKFIAIGYVSFDHSPFHICQFENIFTFNDITDCYISYDIGFNLFIKETDEIPYIILKLGSPNFTQISYNKYDPLCLSQDKYHINLKPAKVNCLNLDTFNTKDFEYLPGLKCPYSFKKKLWLTSLLYLQKPPGIFFNKLNLGTI